ncbi:MAG: hypothetical protein P1P65_08915 [Treponema sp.]
MNKYAFLEICPLDSAQKNTMLIYANGRAFKTDSKTAETALFFQQNNNCSDVYAAEQLGFDISLVEHIRKNIDTIISLSEEKKKWNRRLHFVFFKWKLKKDNAAISVLSHLFSHKAAPILTVCGIAACMFWLYQGIQAQLFTGFPTALLQKLTPSFFLYSYPLVSIFILCHECGHAAALRHYNEIPSEMGGGLYFLNITFFCNVNASWKLKRKERAVVSIGGIYFELILSICLLPFFLFFQRAYPAAASFLSIFMVLMYSNMLHNLYPALYSDGYWLVIDLFGIQSTKQVLTAVIKKITRTPEITVLDSLRKPVLAALFGYTVFSNGVFIVMTVFMLKYAYTFLSTKLPQYITDFRILNAAQYTEFFWGILLTVSVVLMIIRCFKKLSGSLRRIQQVKCRRINNKQIQSNEEY